MKKKNGKVFICLAEANTKRMNPRVYSKVVPYNISWTPPIIM